MDEISVPTEIIFYHGAFVHSITPEGPLQPQSQTRESGSLRKLSGFSEKHLIELSSDMYDELQRRVQANGRKTSPLSPRNDIHWKRNDARRHVGSLPEHRFREICRDLVTEQERRYPELKTGPTYPLQDAMPMAVRPTTSSWISHGSLGSTAHHNSHPSDPSFVSEASENSKETPGLTSKNNDSKLQIQSVSESNITPIKAHIIESDSDSDDEARRSKQKSQMRMSSVIDSQVRGSTVQSPTSSSSPKSVRSLVSGRAAPTNSASPSEPYNDEFNDDSEVTLDSDLEESVPLAAYIHHTSEDANHESPANEPILTSPVTSVHSSQPSSQSLPEKDSKTVVPSQLLSPQSKTVIKSAAELNPSQLDSTSPEEAVASQTLDETPTATEQSPVTSRDYEHNVEEDAPEHTLIWSEPKQDGPSTIEIEQASEIERLRQEVLELRQTLENQKSVTAKVRQEAVQFLREMRDLTEQHEQQVSRAEHADLEITQWKRRHGKLLKEFELISRQRIDHCISLPVVPQPFPSQYKSVDGVVSQQDFNRFLSSVSALVSIIRQKHHSQDILDILHEIITTSRRITTKDTLISRCANQLISVVRNYTVSTGLFPKIIVDSACSDITMAVIDFVKTSKLKVIDGNEPENGSGMQSYTNNTLRSSKTSENQLNYRTNSQSSRTPAAGSANAKKIPHISIPHSNKAAVMSKGVSQGLTSGTTESHEFNAQPSKPKASVDKKAEPNKHKLRETSVGSISKDDHLTIDSFETSIGIANRVTVKSPSVGSVEFFSRENSPAVLKSPIQEIPVEPNQRDLEKPSSTSEGEAKSMKILPKPATISTVDKAILISEEKDGQSSKDGKMEHYSESIKDRLYSDRGEHSINAEKSVDSTVKPYSSTLRKVSFETKAATSEKTATYPSDHEKSRNDLAKLSGLETWSKTTHIDDKELDQSRPSLSEPKLGTETEISSSSLPNPIQYSGNDEPKVQSKESSTGRDDLITREHSDFEKSKPLALNNTNSASLPVKSTLESELNSDYLKISNGGVSTKTKAELESQGPKERVQRLLAHHEGKTVQESVRHPPKEETKPEFKAEPVLKSIHASRQVSNQKLEQYIKHVSEQELSQGVEQEYRREPKLKLPSKQVPKQESMRDTEPKQEPKQDPNQEPKQELKQEPRPENEYKPVLTEELNEKLRPNPETRSKQNNPPEHETEAKPLLTTAPDLPASSDLASKVASSNATTDPSHDSVASKKQVDSTSISHEACPEYSESKSPTNPEPKPRDDSPPQAPHAKALNVPRSDSMRSSDSEQSAYATKESTTASQRDITPDSGTFTHNEPHSGLPYAYSPRFRPVQGPLLPRDECALALHNYLEDQTSHAVDAIGALLSAIKTNAVAGELKPLIVSIQKLVGEMIDTTAKSLGDIRSTILKEKGSFIIQNMRDCLTRMDMIRLDELEAIRDDARPNRHLKQRLAGVNFDMAKCTKELIKSVEEVVLEDEMADLDGRMH